MHGHRLFTWRLLRLHLTLVICVVVFLSLADWQVHRALSGNSLSWAYAFEWPLFTIYAIVLWRKLVMDELGTSERPRGRWQRLFPSWLNAVLTRRQMRNAQRTAAEDFDREQYNAYLSSLRQQDTHGPK